MSHKAGLDNLNALDQEYTRRAYQLALRGSVRQPINFQAGKPSMHPKTKSIAQEGYCSSRQHFGKKGKCSIARDKDEMVVKVREEPLTKKPNPTQSKSSQRLPPQKKHRAELMVIEEGDEVPVEHEPLFGEIVWAQFGSVRSFHPALVIKGSLVNLTVDDGNMAFVFWFSDCKVSTVARADLLDFEVFFQAKLSKGSKVIANGITKAIEEKMRRVVHRGLQPVESDLLEWAHGTFRTTACVADKTRRRSHCKGQMSVNSAPTTTESSSEDFFPPYILNRLQDIGSDVRHKLKLRENRQTSIKEAAGNGYLSVWQGIKSLNDICIACGDESVPAHCLHPVFQGGLCFGCKESLLEAFYALGDDGTHSFCTICGCGGELFVCDVVSCGKVFCVACVEDLGGSSVLNQVPELQYLKDRRPIRVLSLFDGIGTGYTLHYGPQFYKFEDVEAGLEALKRLKLEVEVYYASETDDNAMTVCQANHGDRAVIQLGDVTAITTEQLASIVPVDLLIGGSPSNDFSLANPARKGFDSEGSGVLFFDFYRILRDLQEANGSHHLFWTYENVVSMKNSLRTIISRFLRCQPALWDSKHLSAQKRPRYFWGNLPGLYSTPEMSYALRKDVNLDSVLTSKCHRRANIKQLKTITTNVHSQICLNTLPVMTPHGTDMLWISELERLFGFPAHYTDVGNLNPTRRRALLGRSWSVQVITELLRPLTQYFATTVGPADASDPTPAT